MSALSVLGGRRWDLFQEMDELNAQLGRLFYGERGGSGSAGSVGGRGVVVRDWAPLVDIVEGGDAYLIKVDLPEVDRKDISVKVEDGVLSISGERRVEESGGDRRVHRVERLYGRFVRTFQVPDNVDGSGVSAEFRDGVLRVSLPKVAEAKPKAIDVAVG